MTAAAAKRAVLESNLPAEIVITPAISLPPPAPERPERYSTLQS